MAGGNSSRKAVHPAGAGGGVGAGGGSALLVCSFGGSPAPPLPSRWPGPPIPNVSLWGEGPAGMGRSSRQEWRSWQSQAVPRGGTGCSPEELACGGQGVWSAWGRTGEIFPVRATDSLEFSCDQRGHPECAGQPPQRLPCAPLEPGPWPAAASLVGGWMGRAMVTGGKQ